MSVPDPPNINRLPFASPQALEFEWQPPTNTNGTITGYRLFIGATEVLLDSAARYYKATGLSNGTTYICSLEAANANGYSAKAYFREFQPGSAPTVAPASVTVTVPNPSTALVSWTPPATLPDAQIQWYVIDAQGPNSTISVCAEAATQSNRYIENMNNPYDYTYKVRAVNCPGHSPITSKRLTTPGSALWATRAGGISNEDYPFIKTDPIGNVYMAGAYASATFTLYSYTSAPVSGGDVGTTAYGTLDNSGSTDVYLAKYNSAGTVQWATRIAGTLADTRPALATDASGNLYIAIMYASAPVTIYSYNTAPVGAGAVGLTTYGTMANSGSNDILIVKYNSSGQAQWATKIGSTGSESGIAIATDSSGNVYVSGQYAGTLTISNYSSAPSGGGAVGISTYGTLSFSTGNEVAFLVKYNSSGSTQWATKMGGYIASNAIEYGLATDLQNNVYMTGAWRQTTVIFYNYDTPPVSGGAVGLTTYGSLTNTNTNSTTDLYVVKYNSSGQVQWATKFGSTGSDRYPSVTTDPVGNVYCLGSYTISTLVISQYSSAPVDGGAIGLTTYGTLANANSSNFDMCLIKYNSSGAAQWATRISGITSDASEYLGSVAADAGGNVYVGLYSSSTNTRIFDYTSAPVGGGSIGTTLYATLLGGVILVKYNSSGEAEWVTRNIVSSAPNNACITIDGNANLYITSRYFNVSSVLYNYSSISAGVVRTTQYGTLASSAINTWDMYLARYGS